MALEPLVYFESTATNDTFTKLTAVDSFNLNTDGTELEFPSRNASIPILYAGSGNGAGSIEEARTDIPSLREPSDIYVGQVNDDVQPGGYFFPHQDNSLNPYTPGARQDMEIEVKGADAGTAEEYVVVLMASDGGARSIPDGPQRRIFFSGESQPTTAGEFNRIGISLDQTLQNGDYEVVGASVRNTGSVAYGLDFEDRSGVYGGFTVENEHQPVAPMQQPGGLDSGYGQFRDDAPPDVVLFTTSTGTDVEGHLDIIGPLGG
jgi:hypothetical protein